MSSVGQDLMDISGLFIKSACDGAIATVQSYIQATACVAAQAKAQEDAFREILNKRKQDENWQKLVNAKNFACWLEEKGLYKPEERTSDFIQRKLDEMANTLANLN